MLNGCYYIQHVSPNAISQYKIHNAAVSTHLLTADKVYDGVMGSYLTRAYM